MVSLGRRDAIAFRVFNRSVLRYNFETDFHPSQNLFAYLGTRDFFPSPSPSLPAHSEAAMNELLLASTFGLEV